MAIERKPVESSMLASIGYDPATRTLEVEFHSSGVYQYYDVEPEIFAGLMAAPSHGQYFLGNVRDVYQYAKMGRRRYR